MSLLSYNQLCKLIADGVLENAEYENVNSASIDLRLGRYLLVESNRPEITGSGMPVDDSLKRVVLKKRDQLQMRKYDLIQDGMFILFPGEFILAQSFEVFNLPNNISAEYKLKSSMARIGLEHLNAGWCDAGWNGSVLTLELKNMTRNHEIVLQYQDKIGQIVFFEHEPVPEDKSYAARGRYNGDKEVSGAKKVAADIGIREET